MMLIFDKVSTRALAFYQALELIPLYSTVQNCFRIFLPTSPPLYSTCCDDQNILNKQKVTEQHKQHKYHKTRKEKHKWNAHEEDLKDKDTYKYLQQEIKTNVTANNKELILKKKRHSTFRKHTPLILQSVDTSCTALVSCNQYTQNSPDIKEPIIYL